MSWFKTDPDMLDHPKVKALKPAHRDSALSLWFRAGLWCTKYLTDGVVPAEQIRTFTRSRAAVLELVRVGLWEAVDGGFKFHDWLDYQLAKTEIENRRLQTNQRVSRFRNAVTNASSNAFRNAPSNAGCNGVGNASRNATLDLGSRSREFSELKRSSNSGERARGVNPPGESREGSGEGELATQVGQLLRKRFQSPDNAYVDRQIDTLTAWLEENHPEDPIGVCQVLVDRFAKDSWSRENGFPLGALAKYPDRYLGGSTGLLEAKREAANTALLAGDVDGWRKIQAEIRELGGERHGTR